MLISEELIFGGADLSGAYLEVANLRGANLRGADLSLTELWQADLSLADLREADMSNAAISLTIFADVNLSTVRGLEFVQHEGPSTIGIDTIYRSQGKIPESFLRKAGVPTSLLEVMTAITNHPIEYYTCFISYSSKDEAYAKRLYADLQAKGVRCWFAPENLKIGDKIRAHIEEAIHLQDKLLLLLSEHALASTWVEDEVEAALEREQQQQREVLFPVRLDEQVMQTTQPWAAKLRRTRHIGDFTHWTDPQGYQQAFERLLRDETSPRMVDKSWQ